MRTININLQIGTRDYSIKRKIDSSATMLELNQMVDKIVEMHEKRHGAMVSKILVSM